MTILKAYKNIKGHIMAVFKDHSGTYGVYCGKKEKDCFKKSNYNYPARATRAEAEKDMARIARRSDWELIEFRG